MITLNYTEHADRIYCILPITKKLHGFINEKCLFDMNDNGNLYCRLKTCSGFICVAVIVPDHFNVGKLTTLKFYKKQTPNGSVEYKFYFTPVESEIQHAEKYKESTIFELNDIVPEFMGIDFIDLCIVNDEEE